MKPRYRVVMPDLGIPVSAYAYLETALEAVALGHTLRLAGAAARVEMILQGGEWVDLPDARVQGQRVTA